ncbi:hypothetical protein IMW82_13325 [Rhodanobacter sp. B2A1Ga4]|uniref:hypothetical protein n=1 Tax=Rhodanobacter sp. B2A1Ga4 TaxID=2778647 RepID=UPI001B36583F|nr:hypothetical protein [Rhodanobacter sp. B2A1Ga4]MBQ4855653.1 hypothetical protein [Rhodanobacter sp. B2A1Ga4]
MSKQKQAAAGVNAPPAMQASPHPHLPYILAIADRRIPVRDLYDASAVYQGERDSSGAGMSTWLEGQIYLGTEYVARVSYNGRVWRTKPWVDGDVPLLEPA